MGSYIIAQAVDPNAGTSKRADFFTMGTVALDVPRRKFHVLDVYYGRPEMTEHPYIVEEQYRKWAGPAFWKVGVESIFAQSILYKTLWQRNRIPVKEIARRAGTGNQAMNKYMRLVGFAERYKRGDILHPGILVDGEWVPDYARNPWLEFYEEQLLGLTEAGIVGDTAHDDLPESVAMAVEMLGGLLLSMSATREAPIWHTVQWGGG